MAVLANLARMTTPTTGTGAITLGSAVAGFLTFDEAGVEDGAEVSYAIEDGTDREVGRGTYTATGTTLTRGAVKSTNSDSEIDLSGSAHVFITPIKEDFDEFVTTDGAQTLTNKTLTDPVLNGTPSGTALGIADGKLLKVDGSPADDEFARFTAGGLEGRSASETRGDLSLGTAALKNTGTSGNAVPLLDGANTWSAAQTISALLTAQTFQFTKATATISVDLDDFTTGGWYSGSSLTNAPGGDSGFWYIGVIPYTDTDYILQLAFNLTGAAGSEVMWLRRRVGGTWAAWVQVYGATLYELLGTTRASNAQTASYTLVLTDAGKPVRMNVASSNNLTVPPNSSVAFPVDTYVNIEQYGAGQTTVVAGSGVTIRSRNGLKLGGQYAMATLHKIGTDEWMLGGDLTT